MTWKRVKNILLSFLVGIATSFLGLWFFFLRKTGKSQKHLGDKASQVKKKLKKQEKHLDRERSKEAKEEIEKKVKKKKEELNEKDIHDLTDMFNDEFNR